MKTFKIEPGYKKSFIEIRRFKKEINGKNVYANLEIGWRWGSVLVYVPETKEEVIEWLEETGRINDYDDEDILEFQNISTEDYISQTDDDGNEIQVSTINELFIPTFKKTIDGDNVILSSLNDDDEIELEDYLFELEESWDGCWEDWFISCYQSDDMDLESIKDNIMEIYNESWDSGLEEDGWEMCGCDYYICNGYRLELQES